MKRFVRTAGLSLAAVLGAAHWASAQTGGMVPVYPAGPGAQAKGIETVYPRPPGTRPSGIEVVYTPRPDPRPSTPPAVTRASTPSSLTALAPVNTSPVVVGTQPTVVAGIQPTVVAGIQPDALVPVPDPAAVIPPGAGALPVSDPAVVGGQLNLNVSPTQVPLTLTQPSGPTLQQVNNPGGYRPAYYLPPTSQPLYLPQWRGGADPSANVAPGTAAPMMVNPALYPNGVIIRQYNSPNPYSPPRYVIAPGTAPRR